MTSLLGYYRDPIFSVLLLICLVFIASLASSIASARKQRHLLLRAKEFAAALAPSDELYSLSPSLLAEFGTALLHSGKAHRAKECFALLASSRVEYAYELAVCNIRLGLFAQAVANCELALANIGRDERALKALIYASFKQGDLRAASDAARALALCDARFCGVLKYLEGEHKLSAQLNTAQAFICPHCSHLSYKFEPFCARCFEFATPKIYARIKND